jgi:hypothetical protein
VLTARLGREPTLTGSVTISELDVSVEITLPVRYPNTNYTVIFGGVSTVIGLPSATALLEPSANNKTMGGFTLTLQAAPGVGASVSAPWQVNP